MINPLTHCLKRDYNLARASDPPINTNINELDEEDLDIYITNSTSIIEDELII